MKKFIATNWYWLAKATAMIIFACAFFTFALKNNSVKAGIPYSQSPPTPANVWMVVKGSTVYEVTWDKLTDSYKCKPVCSSLK